MLTSSTVADAVVIGSPFAVIEDDVAAVLNGVDGTITYVVNDPPWSQVRERLPAAARVVHAGDMELTALESLLGDSDEGTTVVGLGGGTALDTAKFLAWRTGRELVQVPTITSVDAGFTDAIGVRVNGKVRYIGRITPRVVVLDVSLIRTAPPRLNRAGIGDILSCLTGLWDWRAASDLGHGHRWRADLAELGQGMLGELDAACADIAAVTADGVRFLADAYRRIGAACAEAGHSRFEEGSEHFWAYCYESRTRVHQVHGELIALGVVALADVQGDGAEWALQLVTRCGTRAHPADLGITKRQFTEALVGLRSYARAEGLDVGVADLREVTDEVAATAWAFVNKLPRVDP